MKTLGFLTDSGQPTERYRRFKDSAQSGLVVAEAMREAYADVFTVDQQANAKNATELKGIFARLSGKGESVNEKMAATFKALAEVADFNAAAAPTPPDAAGDGMRKEEEAAPLPLIDTGFTLRHDIHIHLPISTDIAVYDAIFRSLRGTFG